MRRSLRWLIGVPSVLAVVAAGLVVYVAFIDTDYCRTELHADTGVEPVRADGKVVGFVTWPEWPGQITLMIVRGDTGGPLATAPPWSERLVIEMPRPAAGDRVELDRPDVRLAFGAFDGRQFAAIGPGGIRGHVQVESADPARFVASYDVVVDAVYSQRLPADRNPAVAFQGRSRFTLRPRPETSAEGELWPAPNK